MGVTENPIIIQKLLTAVLGGKSSKIEGEILARLWETQIPSVVYKQQILNALDDQFTSSRHNATCLLIQIPQAIANDKEMISKLIAIAKNEKNNMNVLSLLEKVFSVGCEISMPDIKIFVESLILKALSTPDVRNSEAYSILKGFCKMEASPDLTVFILTALVDKLNRRHHADIRYRAIIND